MKWLSLFAGIGGFDLALEWAGAHVAGQCEIDPYCLKVLEKHWPQVWRWNDIRTLTGDLVREHCGSIDAICGGFPCQDLSVAGKQAGLQGERSGLWFHLLRVIRETGPRWCLIENVPGLLHSGIDIVLGGLEEAGYETWTHLLGADDIGAAHRRKRIWIVARYAGVRLENPHSSERRPQPGGDKRNGQKAGRLEGADRLGLSGQAELADPNAFGCGGRQNNEGPQEATGNRDKSASAAGPAGRLAHAHGNEPEQQEGPIPNKRRRASNGSQSRAGSALADPDPAGRRKRQRPVPGEPKHAAPECGSPSGARGLPDPAQGRLRRGQAPGQSGQPAQPDEGNRSGHKLPEAPAGRGERSLLAEDGGIRTGARDNAGNAVAGSAMAVSNCHNGQRRGGLLQDRGSKGEGATGEAHNSAGNERFAQPGVRGEPHALPGPMDCYRIVARPGQEQFAWEAPRLAKGIKNRSARLKSLGNAIVPHCAYLLIKAIESIEE